MTGTLAPDDVRGAGVPAPVPALRARRGRCTSRRPAPPGFELVDHGVLPGKSELEQLDGACDVPAPDLAPYAAPGPQHSGTFYSAARRTAPSATRSATRRDTGRGTGSRW